MVAPAAFERPHDPGVGPGAQEAARTAGAVDLVEPVVNGLQVVDRLVREVAGRREHQAPHARLLER